MLSPIVIAAALSPLWAAAVAPLPGGSTAPPSSVRCPGPYADGLRALSVEARSFDRGRDAVFSYCARNTATYECLSYNRDGSIRRERLKAVLHGTAFAYKRQGKDTLLLTNEHVAVWPTVTDRDHRVDGVPAGCKRVSEALALVDDEHDSYSRDDISLARVVTDPQLDVAVLKAQSTLLVMPWKIGSSAGLRERNVVEVRGFPLGAFRATNIGKVTSAQDHDEYGEWDHDDFVVDALLSSGNSGSPVLAVSCTTGEYELVGVYHAGYSGGSALNVVVGIDQLRDLMSTLKRAPRPHRDGSAAVDAAGRATIEAALAAPRELFFPFGLQVALVHGAADRTLLFGVFPKDFPSSTEPALLVEDRLPTDDSFGEMGRIWVGSTRGLKAYERAALDAETQGLVSRTLDALRADSLGHTLYRNLLASESGSRQASDQIRRMAITLTRAAASRGELLQGVADLSERLAPPAGERGATLAEITSPSTSPPISPSARGTPQPVAVRAGARP